MDAEPDLLPPVFILQQLYRRVPALSVDAAADRDFLNHVSYTPGEPEGSRDLPRRRFPDLYHRAGDSRHEYLASTPEEPHRTWLTTVLRRGLNLLFGSEENE